MRRGVWLSSIVLGTCAIIGTVSHAQTNDWIGSGDGSWEDAGFWSLAVAPSVSQSAILITNTISKIVAIDAGTASGFPDTMAISNLLVSAQAGSVNTLFLNSVGLAVPLHVLNSFTLSSGGSAVVTNSILEVDGRFLNNGAVALQSGVIIATNSVVELGGFNPSTSSRTGNLIVNGGSLMTLGVSFGGNSSTLTVAGGDIILGSILMGQDDPGSYAMWVSGGNVTVTNGVTSIGISHGNSELTVSNGAVHLSDVEVGGSSFSTTSHGKLSLAGGELVIDGTLRAASGRAASGEIWVTGGRLIATNGGISIATRASAQMTVTNGSVLASSMTVASGLVGSLGTLTVAGGTVEIQSDFSSAVQAPGARAYIWVTGGELTATNGTTTLAAALPSTGVMTVSNGLVRLKDMNVALPEGARGTLSIAGGEVDLSGVLKLAPNPSSFNAPVGTLFVSGGQLAASGVLAGSIPSSQANAGSTGIVSVIGGNLTVTNASHTATIEMRNGTLTINSGRVNTDGLVLTNSSSSIQFNGGTLSTKGTTVNNGSQFTVGNGASAATLNMQGGAHSFSNGLTISSNAVLKGTGTIYANLTLAGTLAPGNSAGAITNFGNVTLQPSAELQFELGGRIPGTEYDFILVTNGVATLDGLLQISFVNGFETNVLNSDTFTLLTADTLSGLFTNAPISGESLTTAGGEGSFLVSYNANNLVLSDYQAIPEPGAWELCVFGLVGLFVLRWRERRRLESCP